MGSTFSQNQSHKFSVSNPYTKNLIELTYEFSCKLKLSSLADSEFSLKSTKNPKHHHISLMINLKFSNMYSNALEHTIFLHQAMKIAESTKI